MNAPMKKEEIMKVARQYSERRLFREEQGRIYRRACKLKILKEVLAHMPKCPQPKKRIHSFEKALKIAKGYKTHADFRKSNNNVYEWLKKKSF